MKVELIDKYLNDELIDQEKKVFDQYMSDEPGFLDEIHLHQEIENAIRQSDVLTLKHQLDDIHDEL